MKVVGHLAQKIGKVHKLIPLMGDAKKLPTDESVRVIDKIPLDNQEKVNSG